MKLVILFTCLLTFNYCFSEVDSTAQKIDVLSAKVEKLKQAVDTLSISKQTKEPKCPPCCGKEVTGWDWLLVYLPIILFISIVYFINRALGSQFKLRDSLTENSLGTKTIIHPAFDQTNPNANALLTQLLANPTTAAALKPTIDISDNSYAPSSSRYAAVITVFFGLGITACFISYYMYSYLKCPGTPIELEKLKDIALALLVGIAPYGFNKLSSSIKAKE